MKRITKYCCVFLLIIFISIHDLHGQGEFAGAKPRALIGKMYNNEHTLPGLPGYEYRWVTVASEEKDTEQFGAG